MRPMFSLVTLITLLGIMAAPVRAAQPEPTAHATTATTTKKNRISVTPRRSHKPAGTSASAKPMATAKPAATPAQTSAPATK